MENSSEPVIFIVKKLNEVFGSKLTLVDFDEKTNIELLQILNNVLAEIDKKIKADVRDEPLVKMIEMLKMLKYFNNKAVPDMFEAGLKAEENKEIIYPILFWLLENLENHKKRAYVARFLYPVEIPAEYMQDSILAEKFRRYKELQQEFKRAHKAFEESRAKENSNKLQEIKADIIAFEDEKKQLQAKIEKLQKLNADTAEFEALLKATEALRLQQDDDARLSENANKQKIALRAAEERKFEATQRLEQLKVGSSTSSSIALLEQLDHQVQHLRQKVHRELPQQVHTKKVQINKLAQARAQPQRSQEDINEISKLCQELETKNKAQKATVDNAVKKRSKSDPKLATSRQHANMVSRKLKDKMRDIDRLEQEKKSHP